MKKAVIALLAASLMLSAASLVSFAEEPAAKPVAWYDFEDSENPGKDKSGNGNDLTLLALISAADNLNLIAGFNI